MLNGTPPPPPKKLIYFMYTSGYEPIQMYEKGGIFQKTVKVIKQTLCHIQVDWSDFLSQLATAKGFLVVQGGDIRGASSPNCELWCLAKLLPKPVRSQALPLRKGLNAVTYSSLNAKCLPVLILCTCCSIHTILTSSSSS